MEIFHERLKNAVVMKPKGRLDASTAQAFKEEVSALIGGKNVNLVIDLKGVDFIDSSGLGCLISALRSAHREGGDIKLASPQDRIRAIFELTRLHKVFEIFPNPGEAERRFETK